jgi:hypothetical protein
MRISGHFWGHLDEMQKINMYVVCWQLVMGLQPWGSPQAEDNDK